MLFSRHHPASVTESLFQRRIEELYGTTQQQIDSWPDLLIAAEGVALSGYLADQLITAHYQESLMLSVFTQLETPVNRRTNDASVALRREAKSIVRKQVDGRDELLAKLSRKWAEHKLAALAQVISDVAVGSLPNTGQALQEMRSLEHRFRFGVPADATIKPN